MTPTDEMLLQDYNRKQIEENIPAIAYAAVVIILGILGNAVAVAYYGFHVKSTVTTFLLTALSVNDFVASIVLNGSFSILLNTINYRSVVGCKLVYFADHVFIGNSLLLLLLIAVDRYLRIRWPLSKRQLSKRSAIIVIVLLITFSIVTSIRDLILIEPLKIDIQVSKYNKTIPGFYCAYLCNQNISITFHIFDMGIVIFVVAALFVIYSAIGQWVLSSRTKRFQIPEQAKSSTKSKTDFFARDVELETTIEAKTDTVDQKLTETTEASSSKEENLKAENKNTRSHESNISNSGAVALERKLTLMAFVITVVSALSFLPYFILRLFGFPSPSKPTEDILSVPVQLGFRSFMISSSVNPYIMGLFNRDFRKFVVELRGKICWCRK